MYLPTLGKYRPYLTYKVCFLFVYVCYINIDVDVNFNFKINFTLNIGIIGREIYQYLGAGGLKKFRRGCLY